jgi:lipopolysaccharide export system protein LptA
VIASEAQLHQATGEATFRGQARLWQQANSIAAPVIVLDRNRQTLIAHATSKAEPVSLTLLSAGSSAGANKPGGGKTEKAQSAPSVIRITGGDLKYSDAERKGVIHGGAAGTVVAETVTATSISNELELVLLPAGNHAAKDGGSAQVDRMTANGQVRINSQGRRGMGERLEYSNETGDYVLTGTAAVPPRMTDPVHGTVTGESLIFNSRDDSVSIEGNGRKTTTETTAPK